MTTSDLKARTTCVAAVAAFVLAGCGSSDGSGDRTGSTLEAETTVVLASAVYTVDDESRVVEAFAYDADGVITAVGSRAEVEAEVGPEAQVLDFEESVVVPGFQDTHVHVPEAGLNLGMCLLPPGETLEVYEDLVGECANAQTDQTWVRAAGASLFDLLDSAERPVDVLDRAVPDRPALILDDLGHAVWTNSAGLEAAGIDADDPDPPGGFYERDDTGAMTGLLLEDAQHRVRDAAAPGPETVDAGLLAALEELARNGVTTVSDAGGYWTRGHDTAWTRIRDEGELTVRARNSLYLFPDRPFDEQVAELRERFVADPDDRLSFDTVKIYVDGILDLGTAALLESYEQPIDPDLPNGFDYFDTDTLAAYANELHEAGFRFEFHVIGDAATRMALDVVAALPRDDRRHRTTHTYLVHPDDRNRFAELGVIADFQAAPGAVDTEYHRSLEPIIGERADDLLPTAALLDAGATVTLSSDWDADPLSPLATMSRVLTRETNAVPDAETALRMVTIDPAFALGHDDRTGSIEVGKLADYVVLDADPIEVDPSDIEEISVLQTVLGGQVVFSQL